MSESSKKQVYKYSLRTTAIASGGICRDKLYAYAVPPDDAITIENLYLHLIIQFNASLSSSIKKIVKIGIANDLTAPTRLRTITLNKAADVNDIVDLRIDLSSLLKNSDVAWRDFFLNPVSYDLTYVYIELPPDFATISNGGYLKLCKMDCLYTTKGIQ